MRLSVLLSAFLHTHPFASSMSATMADCNVTALREEPEPKAMKLTYHPFPLDYGCRFVDAWMNDPSNDGTAMGTRCLLTAVCTFFVLGMMKKDISEVQDTLNAMPPECFQNLWFLSKGQAAGYYFKVICPLTQLPMEVRPEVAAKANSVGVKIEALTQGASSDEHADQINNFVNEKTEGMIKKLVSFSDLEDSSSVMVAAEVLKRHWAYVFSEELTQENEPFHCLDGTKGTCHLMMHPEKRKMLPYMKLQTGGLVLLPTSEKKGGEQDTAWMALFLPNCEDGDPTKSNLSDLRKGSKEIKDKMHDIIKLVHSERHWSLVCLKMPRIDAQTKEPADVTDLLCKNGFRSLFLPGAIAHGLATPMDNGSGEEELVDMPQHAAKALMASVVKVHERGFEAAAAVAIICYRSCGADTQPNVIMECNRPFAMHILKLPTRRGVGSETGADVTPPQFLYSMNVTNDQMLKDAKSALELFGK